MTKNQWRNFVPALFVVILFTLLSYLISFQLQTATRTFSGGESPSSSNILLNVVESKLLKIAVPNKAAPSSPSSPGPVLLGQPSTDFDWNGTVIFGSDAGFTIIGVFLLPNDHRQILFENLTKNLLLNQQQAIAVNICRRNSYGISSFSCENLRNSTQLNENDETVTHFYVNFQNGTSFLIARLFAISPKTKEEKYFFCYGLPQNLTRLNSPSAVVSNACPPCVCSALFSAATLKLLTLPRATLMINGDGDDVLIKTANRLLKNSRFIPCLKMEQNASAAVRRPSDVFLVGDSPSLGAPQSWAVRTLFRNNDMPLALEGGTLLGWYRNCSVVWKDVDVDFSVPSWAVNGAFYKNLIQQSYVDKKALRMDYFDNYSNSSLSFKSTRIFGDVDYGVEVRFDVRRTGRPVVGVDVFILYLQPPGLDYSYIQGFVTWERSILHYALPRNLTLCSTIFFGDLYLVPCEPESYLTCHYGKDWRRPKDRQDSYWRTQPNIVKKIRLSEQDWKKRIMFQSFETGD